MTNGRILITEQLYKDQKYLLAILLKDDRIKRIRVCHESILSNIYRGKILTVSKPVNACFVEIESGKQCFLQMKDNKSYKAGDEITVQVIREAMGVKLPTVSTDLSIAGKYLVINSERRGISYSSKLSQKQKHRIKEYLQGSVIEELSSKFGFTVRTNSEDLNNYDELEKEALTLYSDLEAIVNKAPSRTVFSLLYKGETDYIDFIKNCYDWEYSEIVTDFDYVYEELASKSFIESKTVRLYKDDMLSLSKLYSISSKLDSLLSARVWLKSGGFLIIQPTEAMTVIDVNSGKFEGKNKLHSDMIAKINKEAAEEIIYQLMGRNLSGIIICDFISNDNPEQDLELLDYLRELTKLDPIKTQIVDITKLGLVEITRKKISQTLKEQLKGNEVN